MENMAVHRWIIEDPKHPNVFRAMEAIVREQIGPVVRGKLRPGGWDYYVSKQGGPMWLTVLAPARTADKLTELVTPGLQEPFSAQAVIEDDPVAERNAARYRQALRTVTDIALDLHLASEDELREHQRFLIDIGCTDRYDARPRLDPYLHVHSRTYVAVRDAAAFWEDFYEPGPAKDLSPAGHWLWNLVVGCDCFQGKRPEAVAAAIGI